jgi:beta-lactamase regulating signal transducer with metallopeptidase domain/photosystem II stability/assembly factor-like uncharacterized protein
MNDLSSLFYTMLICSLSGTIAGAVILLLRKLTERLISPDWKCAIWVCLVILLVVPFKIPLDLGGANAVQLSDTAAINNIKQLPDYFSHLHNTQSQTQNGSTNTQTEGNNISPVNTQQNAQALNKQPAVPFNVPDFLIDTVVPIAWLLGIAFMLALMLIGTIRLNRRIRHTSADGVNENILEAVNQCSRIMKLKRPLDVVVQSYIKTPVLAGVLHPKIILPVYAADLDEETLKYIIMHEFSHFKRCDMFTNYLLIIVQAIHWFNPFVWYCFKKMRQDMELATDALVLSRLQNPEHKQYAMSLLSVIGTEQGLTMTPKMLCMVDSPKNIKRRIGMIKLNEFFKKKTLLISLVSVFVVLLIGAVFFTVNPFASANISSGHLDSIARNDEFNDQINSYIVNNSKINNTGNSYKLSSDGTLTFTYDKGKYSSKLPVKLNPERSGFCVSSYKTAVAYIADDNKSVKIIYSDDMGKTWRNSEPILPSLDYYSFTGKDFTSFESIYEIFIDFPTSKCGYIFIGVPTAMGTQNTRDMFKTTDGGRTWHYIQMDSGYTGGQFLRNMRFITENTGYLSGILYGGYGSAMELDRTTDGGLSFTRNHLTLPSKLLGNCWSASPVSLYFVGNKGYIPVVVTTTQPVNSALLTYEIIFYTSDDNGKTWTYEPSMDISASNLESNFANPNSSQNMSSSSLPANTQNSLISSPSNASTTNDGNYRYNTLQSITFLDSKVGYVAAFDNGSSILKTSDSGDHWSSIYKTADAIDKVDFVNQSVGWIVTHQLQYPFGTLVGGGSNVTYTISKTINGGKTFSIQKKITASVKITGVVGGLEKIKMQFYSENNGYILICRNLLKTNDGGQSWKTIAPTSEGFLPISIYFLNDFDGWVAGITDYNYDSEYLIKKNSVVLYHTTNGGKSWDKQYSQAFSYDCIPYDLDFENSNTGFMLVEWGGTFHLYKTQNGGQTMSDISTPIDNSHPMPTMLCFLNPNDGWIPLAVGAMPGWGCLMHTTDGGKSFKDIPENNGMNVQPAVMYDMSEVVFTSDNVGYAIGKNLHQSAFTYNGYIMRTTDGGKTWKCIENWS